MTISNIFGYKVSFSEKLSPGSEMDGCGVRIQTVTKWGWSLQTNRLVPVITDTAPVPETLLKVVCCSCSGVCNTDRCTCRKQGLGCSQPCGLCQNGHCCNTGQDPVSDDDGEM